MVKNIKNKIIYRNKTKKNGNCLVVLASDYQLHSG